MAHFYKPPIIIITSDDLHVEQYDSIEHAERFLDPSTAQYNYFKGYDSEGRLLHVQSIFTKHEGLKVKISVAESKPNHTKELKSLLRETLQRSYDYAKTQGAINIHEWQHQPWNDPTCDIKCLLDLYKTFMPKYPSLKETIIKFLHNKFRNENK